MRFARHLVSHLTPEWRKHYVRYEDLKRKLYEMVQKAECLLQEEVDGAGGDDQQVPSPVNTYLQNEWFEDIAAQLETVVSFYRAQEAKLVHTLRELKIEVDKYELLHANTRTRNIRTTRQKKQNLKLLLSEYYLNLSLLQNFQQLNHTGFRKILKKYDKLAVSTRGKEFFKGQVCESYFWKSSEIPKLIEKTESLMINNMEGGNRSKAMNRLRVPPLESKDVRSHWATLRAGWLMGVIFISFIVLGLGIIFRPRESWNHITPTIRGLRVGFLLTIWFYGFAINTYEWRRTGVNSVLIFEFNPRDYLNFVQLFEIASFVGVVFLVGVFFTVFSHWLNMPEWAGPVIMLGIIAILTLLPLPVLYHTSRLWLLKKLGRIALAPFFAVEFPDFWIADQMNSLAVVLLDMEQFLCYLLLDLTIPGDNIQCGTVLYGIRPVIAVLPAWFRFAQCLRRYYDTRQAFPHLANAGKYSTSFFVVFFGSVAAGLRVGDVDVQTTGYYISLVLWILAHIVSSTYTFTWDVKMDWGLFEGKYKLRSELIYSSKVYYVLAVIEDLVFRSLWTLNISLGNRGSDLIDGNILGTVLGVLEIFRRFVWNFFRLENEHLNNVGEFRAVRDISVHPVDLSQVDVEDEGVVDGGPPQRGRAMPLTLSQLSSHKSPKVRQRQPSLMTIAENSNPIVTMVKPSPRQHKPIAHTDSTMPMLDLQEPESDIDVKSERTEVTFEVHEEESDL